VPGTPPDSAGEEAGTPDIPTPPGEFVLGSSAPRTVGGGRVWHSYGTSCTC
jgi:hypothetical protein